MDEMNVLYLPFFLSFSFQITNLFTETVVSSRLDSVIGPAEGRAHRVAQQ